MSNAKYIKTHDGQIIVFPASLNHTDFKWMSPVSAGFIMFRTDKTTAGFQVDCTCYGESLTLGIKSDPEDTARARSQLGLNH